MKEYCLVYMPNCQFYCGGECVYSGAMQENKAQMRMCNMQFTTNNPEQAILQGIAKTLENQREILARLKSMDNQK